MPPSPVMPGQRLPDLVLTNSAGEDVALRGLRGEATLLIFLRHLG
jgi:peroxiredoxin